MSKESKSGKTGPGADPSLRSLEIGSVVYPTRLTTKFENRKQWERPDSRKVLSVIPGTIQKLMVSEGDAVEDGTPLMILEAMKMRNEVRAAISGVVKKIYVSVGEKVPKEYVLLEYE
jgi:biotin carboxyl carrier protein